MKYLLFLLLTCLPFIANAQCQLCYLSEAQAKQVVNYLNYDSEIVLYYSNCTQGSKDVARRIKIKKAFYTKSDRSDLYEIWLTGTVIATFDIVGRRTENYVKNDMPFSDTIDLAFSHIRAGGYAGENNVQVWEGVSLGIFLGFDCDPCIEPFLYPSEYGE